MVERIKNPSSKEQFNRRDFLSLNFTNRQKDQSPTIKQNEKWKEFEPISLNGSTIRFLGLKHSSWGDVPWEMKSKIREVADWSDIILLEYLPLKIEYNPETFTSKWLIGPSRRNSMNFYKKLYDQILTKYKDTGKMIGSINPEGTLYMLWDYYLDYFDSLNFLRITMYPLLSKKRMTRYELLKESKRIVPIAYLKGRYSFAGIIAKLILAPKSFNNKNNNLEDTLLADTTNFRNVRIAENLVRLTEMLQEEESRRISYIGNIKHLNAIRSYVTEEHDLERKLKKPFHTLHSFFTKPDDIEIYDL